MGFLDVNEVRTRYTATDETAAAVRSARGGMDDVLGKLGAMAAGYLSVGAAVGVLKTSIADAREIQAFNVRLGASVEGLQRLKFAAQLANVQFGQVTIGMQRMTRRVAEAAQGMGEAQGALRELGVDAARLSTMLPDKQFDVLMKKLEGVASRSDRVRLAFKLFDSEGVGLIQMLDELGSKRVEDIPILSQKNVDRLVVIGQALDLIVTKAKAYGSLAIANTIGRTLEPGFLGLIGDRPPSPPQSQTFGEFGASMLDPAKVRAQVEAMVKARAKVAEAIPEVRQFGAAARDAQAATDAWVNSLGLTDNAVTDMKAIGEAMDVAATSAAGVSRETAELAERMLAAGVSVDVVVANLDRLNPTNVRIAEWAANAEAEMQNLGATMVDVAYGFSDTWADAMTRSIMGVQSFAEAAKQAFRDLAAEAIRQLNRIIAKQIIAGIIKAVTGVPVPTGGGGGGPGFDVGGDVGVVAAANYGGVGGSGVPAMAFAVPRGGAGRTVNVNATIRATFASRAEVRAAASVLQAAIMESGR